MKNITVFWPLVIISAVLCLGTLSFPPVLQGQTEFNKPEAGDFPYVFSVSPLAGFLYGYAEEIVYNGKSSTYLSQLLWDIKPLVYSGAILDISRKKNPGFFYSISLKFGFPMRSGIMEDRDWVNAKGALTHYSRHDSRIDEAWFHDFLGGISLPFFGSRVLFKPYLGVSYTHLRWIASDGYTKYSEEDPAGSGSYPPLQDSEPEEPISGRVVSYTQEWMVLFFGVSLSYAFHPRFSAGLSVRISPLLYFTGEDYHYKREPEIRFSDYILGGFYLEPGGEFSFSFNKWFSAGLYVSWRYLKGSPNGGLTTSNPIGGTVSRSPTAGAAWQTLDLGLRMGLRF
ncbi:MAG: omptin family outer membrane protease [Treponema sp.]|nr:omptin family outer membrane protease [Treponema sp.]